MKLTPNLTGRPADERNLLALPARLGGIAVNNPAYIENCHTSKSCHTRSHRIILTRSASLSTKREVLQTKRNQANQQAKDLKQHLPYTLRRTMDLATEKGASSWLTTWPIEDLGFSLHKGAFKDALGLRYGWHPTRAPSNCTCGVSFTVKHALSCPRGGFPILRHNELSDVTASLLTEVCHKV